MNESDFLRFLLSNRLHVEYSINDLRVEVRHRLNELGEGCGEKVIIPFDSRHPDKGVTAMNCGNGVICKECSYISSDKYERSKE